jgi:hypothetical protein
MPSNDDLTVDGYPIGQVVVAGNASPRRDPEPEDSREALVRQELAEIADTGDADAALAEVYDGYLDKVKRRKALDLYEKQLEILNDGGCAWFTEYATLDGELVEAENEFVFAVSKLLTE